MSNNVSVAAGGPIRLRRMLKSKIHRITVTGANIDYVGSLTVDARLLEAADIYEHEELDVVNVTNGARFSTYAISGGPGECCLNGAAARLGLRGDVLIVMTFDFISEDLAVDWKPRVVFVDEANRDATIEEL